MLVLPPQRQLPAPDAMLEKVLTDASQRNSHAKSWLSAAVAAAVFLTAGGVYYSVTHVAKEDRTVVAASPTPSPSVPEPTPTKVADGGVVYYTVLERRTFSVNGVRYVQVTPWVTWTEANFPYYEAYLEVGDYVLPPVDPPSGKKMLNVPDSRSAVEGFVLGTFTFELPADAAGEINFSIGTSEQDSQIISSEYKVPVVGQDALLSYPLGDAKPLSLLTHNTMAAGGLQAVVTDIATGSSGIQLRVSVCNVKGAGNLVSSIADWPGAQNVTGAKFGEVKLSLGQCREGKLRYPAALKSITFAHGPEREAREVTVVQKALFGTPGFELGQTMGIFAEGEQRSDAAIQVLLPQATPVQVSKVEVVTGLGKTLETKDYQLSQTTGQRPTLDIQVSEIGTYDGLVLLRLTTDQGVVELPLR